MSEVNGTELESKCYEEFYENTLVLWTFIVILTVLILFTLVGNALVCLALFVDKSLRTPANIFLLNMSFGDIIVTFTVILTDYSYVIFFPKWTLGALGNWIYNIGFVTFLIVPFLTVTAVTIDRYLSILYPLRYVLLVTKTRVVLCVLVLWLYTIVAVSLTVAFAFTKDVADDYWQFLLPNPYYLAIILCHTVLPLILIIILYLRIYFVARRHSRQIASLSRRFSAHEEGSRFMVSQLKAARTVFIVIVMLALSWLPFIVNESLMYYVYPQRLYCVFLKFGAVANYITYFNGALNPFVYALRHRRFFLVYKRIIFCRF